MRSQSNFGQITNLSPDRSFQCYLSVHKKEHPKVCPFFLSFFNFIKAGFETVRWRIGRFNQLLCPCSRMETGTILETAVENWHGLWNQGQLCWWDAFTILLLACQYWGQTQDIVLVIFPRERAVQSSCRHGHSVTSPSPQTASWWSRQESGVNSKHLSKRLLWPHGFGECGWGVRTKSQMYVTPSTTWGLRS